VAKRSLENFINEEKRSEMEQQELLDKIAALEATIEELRKKPEEPANVDNANTIDEEVRSLQNKIEDLEAQLETSKEETRNNNTNLNKTKEMTKFSLLRAINDIANGRQLDERAVEVVNAGREEMRKAGQSYAGQIVLPVEERAGYIQATVATAGQEIVAEDKLNILEGLRAKSVLAAAGATYMTGLTGNVSIPKYSNSQVGWEGEVNPAQDGKGEFSDVKFAPKRLTAYLDISKQFLAQDSVAAEEMLKRDIVNAITDKLEATILGGDAASTTQPAGLMNGASAVTVNHANIVGLEQTLEDNNVSGDLKMIVSPAIKAKLKTTALDSGSGRFLMEGNECNGYQVLSTTNCKGLIMGRFEDLVIAQWGA
jgi:HK97 family phage major capsid protein